MSEQSGNSGQLQGDAMAVEGSVELRRRTDGERAAYFEGVEQGKLIAARQPVGQEPVAWQWRSRITGGAWDTWENGRYCSEPAPFMDVEHRALYTAPPAPAAVPPDVLREAMSLADAVEKNGEWNDGCFYYNRHAASELQTPLTNLRRALAAHPQPAAADIDAARYRYLRDQPVEGGPYGTPRIAIPSSESRGQFANGEDADAAIDAAIAAAAQADQQAKPAGEVQP
ncbi:MULTISPECIES: hypothetical protein [Xanthomonas]|uniref:hypothetical protein n=1 Tax=Xanthomonas TaxID=338 RepID=UPI001ADB2EBC|nr:hypothetical protein [Xanthomonas phaseoli]MBO9766468.1 hypothetical protein [Xanthomonas phaseoli pv. dieffenbachiae]MBO9776187.1 hypothetical protein [Xanthomonas phaseoli pv. dieffenbachiae]MBO9778214.1 hypothetical protein [Xanthomonas phaseoli pv. dieffenbachiae]MBO9795397.1 hypothetical protein [Xanthomonas phaseoli pv. dieffenbachiae]MBO9801408.1 hypothetical protein [Xanthomonas phaseoli pv. dieffenbachiae]